jgi:alkylation response protein AidB-like acyl-CoA dehydrogenase
MHQHTVLSLAWRWRLGDDEVEPTLRRIASEGLLLSSSGTADLSNPSVTATPTEGGLLVSGQKRFCSGVPGVDVIATMARVDDGTERWNANVLIPASAPGTEIVPDWDAMGMRGSGSNPVIFTDVFVPEDNIMYLRPIRSLGGGQAPADQDGDAAPPPARPGNGGRPAVANGQSGAPDSLRMPGLQIALTVIAAVYLGAAEGVRDQALRMTARQGADDPAKQRLAGLLTHEYRSATWALDTIIMDTDDDSLGTEDHFITTMLAKRQVILSSIKVVELSMELLGSRTYMRSLPFEQALRDVRAGITHPLAPDKTLFEVGKSVLQRFARQQAR